MRSPSHLRRLHATACFLAAFPDNASVLGAAGELLGGWTDRMQSLSPIQRESLIHTGMAGTCVYYEFSYHTACQLADRFPAALEINWNEYEAPDKLDALLAELIGRAEEATFESEEAGITTQDWVTLAKGGRSEPDLSWLLRQTRSSKTLHRFAETLYDESEVPLLWRLGNTSAATTNNTFDTGCAVFRSHMRKPPRHPKNTIAMPMRGIRLLNAARGQALINASIDALAARQREVFSITQANAKEVYLAPLGHGTYAAIMGVLPQHRLHLEGNYGYILLAGGRPIGYGGISPLFLQGNTGINIFPEYRGGEAAFLFVQLLRAFRMLFGVTRFVANPYQFGRNNHEAIKSGAFWFYYKIGFRPVDASAARFARHEYNKILAKRRHQTDPRALRQLARSDLHLALQGSKKSEFFEERWLTTCAQGATAAIAAQTGIDRNDQMKRLTRQVANALGAADRRSWGMHERLALERLAPTIALIADLDGWTRAQKNALVRLVRAKSAPQERGYVRRLGRHRRFRESLTRFCRRP